MSSSRQVLLAAPRGYCAGVDRAVQTVEEALAKAQAITNEAMEAAGYR